MMKRLPPPAHEAFTVWMESLPLNQDQPIASISAFFVILFGPESLANMWAALHTARWITIHDRTGRRIKPEPHLCKHDTFYHCTPLFSTDYTRLNAAVEEATLVNA
jgi:hypothetical protein